MQVFQALASESRVKILELLLDGKHCCNGLAEQLSLDQSTVSRHLSELESAGLISLVKNGKSKDCVVNRKQEVEKLLELAKKIGQRS